MGTAKQQGMYTRCFNSQKRFPKDQCYRIYALGAEKSQFPEMGRKEVVWILIAVVVVQIILVIRWGKQSGKDKADNSKYRSTIVPSAGLNYVKKPSKIKEARGMKLKNLKLHIGRKASEKELKSIGDNIGRKVSGIEGDNIKHDTLRKVKEMKFRKIWHDVGKDAKELRLKNVRHNVGSDAEMVQLENIRYNTRRNENIMELKNIRHIIGGKAEGMELKNTRDNTKGKGNEMALKNFENNIGRKTKEMELMNAIERAKEVESEHFRNSAGRNAKRMEFMNVKRNAIGRGKGVKVKNFRHGTGRSTEKMELKKIKNNARPKVEEMDFKNIIIRVGKQRGMLVYRVLKAQKKYNLATVVVSGCKETKHATGKIELITSFIDFARNNAYMRTIEDLVNRPDVIEARQMEVLDVLQGNLLHPVIERVHMLVWEKDTAEYIRSLPLKNSEKLILRVTGKDVGLKEQLLYASECLSNRIIAISNQDNKIGKGWNNTEYHQVLRENNVMYALTRHSPIETNCTWLNDIGTCDYSEWQISTHDTFVLLAKKWKAQVFNEISSITPDMLGMENLFMWFFQNKLKYRILNPCKRLYVHHHHCVPIRGANRPRVNNGDRSVFIDFTDRLNIT